MNIKKGDTVRVRTGKDRGKRGEVVRVFPDEGRVTVKDLNLVKRAMKARRAGEKGQIVTLAKPLNVSNVELVCAACGKPTRIGHRMEGETKRRVCKNCGATV